MTAVHEWVKCEIEMAKERYPSLDYGEQLNWVLIPDYPLPRSRYTKERTKILFMIPPGYPSTAPDDFFVDGDLRLREGGTPPGFNQGPNSSSGPAPVPGDWGWFSWHPSSWRPGATIEGGDNLLTFLRGVGMCLRGEESP